MAKEKPADLISNVIEFPGRGPVDSPFSSKEIPKALKDIQKLEKRIFELREELAIVEDALQAELGELQETPDDEAEREAAKDTFGMRVLKKLAGQKKDKRKLSALHLKKEKPDWVKRLTRFQYQEVSETGEMIRKELVEQISLRDALIRRLSPDYEEQLRVQRRVMEDMHLKLGRKLSKIVERSMSDWQKELIESESRAWRRFFGAKIEIPPPPKEITVERLARWQEQGFEVHYLPAIELKQDANYPGWKNRPDGVFWNFIKEDPLMKNAAKLFGGWILIDARNKPNFDDNKQIYMNYKNDVLAPVLVDLNKQNVIKQARYDGFILPADTRFGMSALELEKSEVRKAFAEALDLREDQIDLPSAIEWNVIANIFHPEWNYTDAWERFKDKIYKGRRRLIGGRFDSDGRSRVCGDHDSHVRDMNTGFRLVGRLSSE